MGPEDPTSPAVMSYRWAVFKKRVFFFFKPVVKTEMGRKDASLIFFGECARNEKLNDRGVVKK